MTKPVIRYIVSMGDSLSDPGAMAHRKLMYIISMYRLSGLKGKSPDGAFTNGETWITDVGEEISEKEIIESLKKGKKIVKTEDDYKRLELNYQDFLRYYDEGGATSYDYSQNIMSSITLKPDSIKLAGTKAIVSNLKKKRRLLLADDKYRGITDDQKAQTLVTEWSGANDLITVNEKPTKEEAKEAVDARIENVKELIENGYRHFALFNLPDLSLTPYFHEKSQAERDNAHEICQYFNDELKRQIEELKKVYTEENGYHIDLFDANKAFTHVYHNPENYGFDRNKLTQPYTEIKGFNLNNPPSAKGYMFWDKIHPTEAVHEIIAQNFETEYTEKYEFAVPHESLITVFREHYGQKWKDDLDGFFGFFRKSRFTNYKDKGLSLDEIFRHALFEDGKRSRAVIMQLGWIDSNGQLLATHKPLVQAWEQVQKDHQETPSCLSWIKF